MSMRPLMILLLMLLLPLGLAACAQNGKTPPAVDAAPAQTQAAAVDSVALAGYQWTLESATDAQGKRVEALFPGNGSTLVLTFADGSANVSGGCNGMRGAYTLDAGDALTIGPMRSTMMACAQPLMRADEAIGALLAKPQKVQINDGAPPRLQLTSNAGEASTWIGKASAEKRYGSAGETVFMEVAPQRIACNHPLIPNHQCLQVREIRYDAAGLKQSPPGPWQPLYEDIEGFEFHAGERTVLRLKQFKRDPAPADASSIVYVLDMVVESGRAPGK